MVLCDIWQWSLTNLFDRLVYSLFFPINQRCSLYYVDMGLLPHHILWSIFKTQLQHCLFSIPLFLLTIFTRGPIRNLSVRMFSRTRFDYRFLYFVIVCRVFQVIRQHSKK